MKLTNKSGVDTAIEAVGIPATFELCEKIIAPGGVRGSDHLHLILEEAQIIVNEALCSGFDTGSLLRKQHDRTKNMRHFVPSVLTVVSVKIS